MPEYTWNTQGNANQYVVLRGCNWFAAIQLTGIYLVDQQHEFMDTMVAALNQKEAK